MKKPQFSDAVIIKDIKLWPWASCSLKPNDIGILAGNKNSNFLTINFNASAFCTDNYCVCSGGPASILPIQFDILEEIGEFQTEFWNWAGELPGASKGKRFTKIVTLWELIKPIVFVGYNNELKDYDFNIRIED